jgi:hypothetical protein
VIRPILIDQGLKFRHLLSRQFGKTRVPEFNIQGVDPYPVDPLPIDTDLGGKPRPDAIRSRPTPHPIGFDELEHIPLRCLCLFSGRSDDSRTSHVLIKRAAELRQIRVVLKNDNRLVRLDTYNGEPSIPKFFRNCVGRRARRQRDEENEMRSEPLNSGSPTRLGFDLVNFV